MASIGPTERDESEEAGNSQSNNMPPLFLDSNTKKAMESIAPILEGFTPKTSSSENKSLKLPPAGFTSDDDDETNKLVRTLSISSTGSASRHVNPLALGTSYDGSGGAGTKLQRLKSNQSGAGSVNTIVENSPSPSPMLEEPHAFPFIRKLRPLMMQTVAVLIH